MQEQFGLGFDRLRDFRRSFLHTLHHVQSVYPSASLTVDEGGLTLHHSPPPIHNRYHPVLLPGSPSPLAGNQQV